MEINRSLDIIIGSRKCYFCNLCGISVKNDVQSDGRLHFHSHIATNLQSRSHLLTTGLVSGFTYNWTILKY